MAPSVGEHREGGSESLGAAIPHRNAVINLPDGSLQLLTHKTR